ncbi:DMT family transporter [Falsiphaeobacter marinintestinus]|uniref:DMT family transporter n=1 Tax=Falsiphaeobacter marinintestinus TaxID=1492905 RepID=UPI0011B76E34|nr:DMT family transporter [Phaeobacter marinintestinus]
MPVALAFVAAAIWGLWWVPIRVLEAQGLTGAMAGVAMNAGALAGSLIWMALRRSPLRLDRLAIVGTVLVGAAVSTYSVALTTTDVVRAVLLFYMAPAWAKIIEWAFLGLPWRWTSTFALVAALTGAVLFLGGDVTLDDIRLGDMLAIVSGVAWAAGATLVFTRGGPTLSLTMVTSASAVGFGLLFGLLTTGGLALNAPGAFAAGMGTGALYVLPMLLLTLWSARKLPPATLTFLLTAEILTGVISGVVFLGEPFGPLQVAGAILIVLGAIAEVLPTLMRLRNQNTT